MKYRRLGARGPTVSAIGLGAGSATTHFGERDGEVQIETMPHVRSGKLRALGVAGLARSSAAPDLPTIAESGLPGFEVIGWWGLLAPAKTPRSAVDLLNRELRAALDLPDVRRTLLDQGMDPAGGTPEQFGALIRADMDKWGEIGRRLGVKLD